MMWPLVLPGAQSFFYWVCWDVTMAPLKVRKAEMLQLYSTLHFAAAESMNFEVEAASC